MNARVVFRGKSAPKEERYTVEIYHGHQAFLLQYQASQLECEWMVRMFEKALAAHDKERRCVSGVSGKSNKTSSTRSRVSPKRTPIVGKKHDG